MDDQSRNRFRNIAICIFLVCIALGKLIDKYNIGAPETPIYPVKTKDQNINIVTVGDPLYFAWRIGNVSEQNGILLAGTAKGYALWRDKNEDDWQVHSVSNEGVYLSQSAFLPDGTAVLLAPDSGILFISHDNGATWEKNLLNEQDSDSKKILLTSDGILLARTYDGFLRSDNLAKSWHPIASSITPLTGPTSSEDSLKRSIEIVDFSSDEDLAVSGNLQHWFRVIGNQSEISHDSGNSVVKTELPTNGQIVSSAIAEDGKLIVAIFKNDSPLQNVYDPPTSQSLFARGASFQLLLSHDGDSNFETSHIDADDIFSINIFESGTGEYAVFKDIRHGIAFYEKASLTNEIFNDSATTSILKSGAGNYLGGGALTRLEGNFLYRLTTTENNYGHTCLPDTWSTDRTHQLIVGLGQNCVLHSSDSGENWKTQNLDIELGHADPLQDWRRRYDKSLFITSENVILANYKNVDMDNDMTVISDIWLRSDHRHILMEKAEGQDSIYRTHEEDIASPSVGLYRPITLKLPDHTFSGVNADCDTERQRNKYSCLALDRSTGRAFQSLDGGRSWKNIKLPITPISVDSGYSSIDGQFILLIATGKILISRDGDISFTSKTLSPSDVGEEPPENAANFSSSNSM